MFFLVLLLGISSPEKIHYMHDPVYTLLEATPVTLTHQNFPEPSDKIILLREL